MERYLLYIVRETDNFKTKYEKHQEYNLIKLLRIMSSMIPFLLEKIVIKYQGILVY